MSQAMLGNRDGNSASGLNCPWEQALGWRETMASLAKDSGGEWGASSVPNPQEAVTEQTLSSELRGERCLRGRQCQAGVHFSGSLVGGRPRGAAPLSPPPPFLPPAWGPGVGRLRGTGARLCGGHREAMAGAAGRPAGGRVPPIPRGPPRMPAPGSLAPPP